MKDHQTHKEAIYCEYEWAERTDLVCEENQILASLETKYKITTDRMFKDKKVESEKWETNNRLSWLGISYGHDCWFFICLPAINIYNSCTKYTHW
jgi:hypothetical protein